MRFANCGICTYMRLFLVFYFSLLLNFFFIFFFLSSLHPSVLLGGCAGGPGCAGRYYIRVLERPHHGPQGLCSLSLRIFSVYPDFTSSELLLLILNCFHLVLFATLCCTYIHPVNTYMNIYILGRRFRGGHRLLALLADRRGRALRHGRANRRRRHCAHSDLGHLSAGREWGRGLRAGAFGDRGPAGQ